MSPHTIQYLTVQSPVILNLPIRFLSMVNSTVANEVRPSPFLWAVLSSCLETPIKDTARCPAAVPGPYATTFTAVPIVTAS
jgi:hypothetical protein